MGKFRYWLVAFVLVAGGTFFWWYLHLAKTTASYSVSLHTNGELQSAQLPATHIAIDAEGSLSVHQLSDTSYELGAVLVVKAVFNGTENGELASALAHLLEEPIRVKTNTNGQALAIGYAHSLDSMNAEVALNLWRTLVSALFLPKAIGEQMPGQDLWGLAELSVACATDCLLQSVSQTNPPGLQLKGSSKAEWKRKPTGLPAYVKWQAENEIKHVIFRATSVNSVEYKSSFSFAKSTKNISQNLAEYPAHIESDGKRNKLRSLRAQFANIPLENFLEKIRSFTDKEKSTVVYETIENALLLFPDQAEAVAALAYETRLNPKLKPILVSALLRASDAKVQNVAQAMILAPRFKPFLKSALFTLRFDSNASPAWAETLQKLALQYPEYAGTAEFSLCSLAGATSDITLIKNRIEKKAVELPKSILMNHILCLGNAGLIESLPFLEEAWLIPEMREAVLFALRFVRGLKVMPFFQEAAADAGLVPVLFQTLELRLNRGFHDTGLKEMVSGIEVAKMRGRADLVIVKKRLLRVLDEHAEQLLR